MPRKRFSLKRTIRRFERTSPRLFWVACLALVPVAALADKEQEARYPYDPACAWGRLSNGRGMLHRCITEAEAKNLSGQEPSELKSRGTLPEQGKAETESPPSADEPSGRAFALTVGPIEAEEGELSLGALGKPLDRYRECVEKNGGLTANKGRVVVRFLVRAERARAEGTEVDSYSGVSQLAAQCIASVVDRRQVGSPNVPMTGTKLTFQLQERR